MMNEKIEKINKSNWKEWWEIESQKNNISFTDNLDSSAIEDMLQTVYNKIPSKTPSKLPKEIVSGDFPPSNIYLDKDGNYCIYCAVAGYSSDLIKVKYVDNYINLSLSPPLDNWPDIPIQYGIKLPGIALNCKFYIDDSVFDIKNIKTVLKDGILKITAPLYKESEPEELEFTVIEN